jgi:hypothetical protein
MLRRIEITFKLELFAISYNYYMIKFSLLLSVIAAPVNMSGQIITLNKPTTVGADDLYEFIYDRTFSFAGSNNANMLEYVGTGWIYKHISNYKYYLFTN